MTIQKSKSFKLNFGPQHPSAHGDSKTLLGLQRAQIGFWYKNSFVERMLRIRDELVSITATVLIRLCVAWIKVCWFVVVTAIYNLMTYEMIRCWFGIPAAIALLVYVYDWRVMKIRKQNAITPWNQSRKSRSPAERIFIFPAHVLCYWPVERVFYQTTSNVDEHPIVGFCLHWICYAWIFCPNIVLISMFNTAAFGIDYLSDNLFVTAHCVGEKGAAGAADTAKKICKVAAKAPTFSHYQFAWVQLPAGHWGSTAPTNVFLRFDSCLPLDFQLFNPKQATWFIPIISPEYTAGLAKLLQQSNQFNSGTPLTHFTSWTRQLDDVKCFGFFQGLHFPDPWAVAAKVVAKKGGSLPSEWAESTRKFITVAADTTRRDSNDVLATLVNNARSIDATLRIEQDPSVGPTDEVQALREVLRAFRGWSYGPDIHPLDRAAWICSNQHDVLSPVHELGMHSLRVSLDEPNQPKIGSSFHSYAAVLKRDRQVSGTVDFGTSTMKGRSSVYKTAGDTLWYSYKMGGARQALTETKLSVLGIKAPASADGFLEGLSLETSQSKFTGSDLGPVVKTANKNGASYNSIVSYNLCPYLKLEDDGNLTVTNTADLHSKVILIKKTTIIYDAQRMACVKAEHIFAAKMKQSVAAGNHGVPAPAIDFILLKTKIYSIPDKPSSTLDYDPSKYSVAPKLVVIRTPADMAKLDIGRSSKA